MGAFRGTWTAATRGVTPSPQSTVPQVHTNRNWSRVRNSGLFRRGMDMIGLTVAGEGGVAVPGMGADDVRGWRTGEVA